MDADVLTRQATWALAYMAFIRLLWDQLPGYIWIEKKSWFRYDFYGWDIRFAEQQIPEILNCCIACRQVIGHVALVAIIWTTALVLYT